MSLVTEERDLTNAYRATKRAPAPQGQGLNDLYVRFFRMAERRIVEHTGRGVVCLISNYSWLDGLSFTGMRERYLEAFDRIWIDCLNGDKYRTGKLTPDREPDPSIFSTESNPEGIQVGTAIALLIRRQGHEPTDTLRFRHLWGKTKRAALLQTREDEGQDFYQEICPPSSLGFPFMPTEIAPGYLDWPTLPRLLPVGFPGVQTGRDADLVDVDLKKLTDRTQAYFDPGLTDEVVRRVVPSIMTPTARYDPAAVRKYLMDRGLSSGYFTRYSYRPFDSRHIFWHAETDLLDRNRQELFRAAQAGNLFLTSRQKAERGNEGTPFLATRHLADRHLTRPGSILYPLTLCGVEAQAPLLRVVGSPGDGPAPNLSAGALAYLESIDQPREEASVPPGAVWMHCLATGYSPAYLLENVAALRQDWPHIPLPAERDRLLASAALGQRIAALLDPETAVSGATSGAIRPELKTIGSILRHDGAQLKPEAGDLKVTVGWGHRGLEGVAMPGQGKLVRRDYAPDEVAALDQGAAGLGFSSAEARRLLGDGTLDVYLNDVACWRNVPARVWQYTIGGYQVLKKWLSYREADLLGRDLSPTEAREFTHMARRIAAILLLEPELDANYHAASAAPFPWPVKSAVFS